MIEDLIDYKYANVCGIYGHLGGGKSLTAVEIMVDFLRRGFPAVSNIALRGVSSFRGQYQFIEDFSTVDFWSLPCGAPRGTPSPLRSAIVIDEAAEMLDQYSAIPLLQSRSFLGFDILASGVNLSFLLFSVLNF